MSKLPNEICAFHAWALYRPSVKDKRYWVCKDCCLNDGLNTRVENINLDKHVKKHDRESIGCCGGDKVH